MEKSLYMKAYDHKDIEAKWQKEWESAATYKTTEDSTKPKQYVLDMFPYPSGEGLHVGHPRGYIATDVYSRKKRMEGFNVLHPMGWDAFGLPAENYAIKNQVHPRVAVEKNVARFKEQLSLIGLDYDWSREINTTDPAFYKWTQWIFLQMLKKGLAYESNEPVNWCPTDKTVLANEDVEPDGTCERCGTKVEKKAMRQWVLKITDYADRMLEDLDKLPKWPEGVKEAQRNWIGRNEGSEIDFPIEGQPEHPIKVFTTRADTLFGVTFIAVSAGLAKKWIDMGWKASPDVQVYIEQALAQESVRDFKEKEKTGIPAGFDAINPGTKEKVPIWITNYVMSDVGTGAIMGVPAHDERDFEFALKYNLKIIDVVDPNPKLIDEYYKKIGYDKRCYTGSGVLINSNQFNGLTSEEARTKITEFVGGKMISTYRIKDWVFSRQRYWGEPIPVIHCEKCGVVPVPEDQLPVLLPEVTKYEPTGRGESPLADIAEWVNTPCPTCGGAAKRETNTMPQWAGSSWYYLRYIDPNNGEALINPTKEKQWMPVDVYVGGDHATRHLIYARFWHKFLFDIGVVTTEEPFPRLEFLGFILAEDGRKMSKRWGNIVNPDDVIKQFGADAFRLYEMFIGPFEGTVPWSTNGLVGTRRFVEKVWRYVKDKTVERFIEDGGKERLDGYRNGDVMSSYNDKRLQIKIHKCIKKVSEDIESFKFNTAISELMIIFNELLQESKSGYMSESLTTGIPYKDLSSLLRILAPFAPHMTEELWHELGETSSIHLSEWPKADEALLVDDTVTIGVQINGKVRDELTIAVSATKQEIEHAARELPRIKEYTEGKSIKNVIVVPGRIINILTE